MRISVHAAPESASKAIAGNCIDLPKPAIALIAVAESCKWFPPLAKLLSRNKPASALHYLTEAPERTCYAWVEGKSDPPARAILKLLHSDAGWTVLDYLMRGCRQPWWLDLVRARHCAAAYEQARGQ